MEDPAFGTVMVGVLKVCCVSITIFIVDRFGRKKLMILSLTGKDSYKQLKPSSWTKLISSLFSEIDNTVARISYNMIRIGTFNSAMST